MFNQILALLRNLLNYLYYVQKDYTGERYSARDIKLLIFIIQQKSALHPFIYVGKSWKEHDLPLKNGLKIQLVFIQPDMLNYRQTGKGDGDLLAAEVSRQDLFKACESLFGTDIDVSVEFLRYLKPAGVRAAYRKKAMETHPDRAILVARRTGLFGKRFKKQQSGLSSCCRNFLSLPGNIAG